nr:hypothetical protein [Prolixibacteraceae bacterium]
MSIFSFFAKSNRKNKTTDDAIRDLEPGRSSIASEDDWDGMINTAMFGSSQAKGFFPFELIDAITRLSIINPDLSMAVRNISLLGNTGHTVEIYADESVADAFSEELKNAAAKIFSEGAGIDGFINTLFGQLARTGALSAEWVINETVDDI